MVGGAFSIGVVAVLFAGVADKASGFFDELAVRWRWAKTRNPACWKVQRLNSPPKNCGWLRKHWLKSPGSSAATICSAGFSASSVSASKPSV